VGARGIGGITEADVFETDGAAHRRHFGAGAATRLDRVIEHIPQPVD